MDSAMQKLEKLIQEKAPQWLKDEIAYWTEWEPEGDDEGEEGYTFADAWERVCDERFSVAAEKPGCIRGKTNEWGPDEKQVRTAKNDRRVLKQLAKEAGVEI